MTSGWWPGSWDFFSFCTVSKCRGTSVGRQDKLMRWRCVSDSQLLCHCDSMPVSRKVYGSFMISDISGLWWNSVVTDEEMLKHWQQSVDHTVRIVEGFVKISNWSTQNESINQVKVNILTLQVLNFLYCCFITQASYDSTPAEWSAAPVYLCSLQIIYRET